MKIYDGIFDEKRDELYWYYKALYEQNYAERNKEAIGRWVKEGYNEARRETLRTFLKLIFSCLHKCQFNAQISNETTKILEKINDLKTLQKILDFAVDAPTMKDFEDFVTSL